MSDMRETTAQCECGNSTFFVIEGHDYYSYVYFKCTDCKKEYGVSTSPYGDTTTDIPNKED